MYRFKKYDIILKYKVFLWPFIIIIFYQFISEFPNSVVNKEAENNESNAPWIIRLIKFVWNIFYGCVNRTLVTTQEYSAYFGDCSSLRFIDS